MSSTYFDMKLTNNFASASFLSMVRANIISAKTISFPGCFKFSVISRFAQRLLNHLNQSTIKSHTRSYDPVDLFFR